MKTCLPAAALSLALAIVAPGAAWSKETGASPAIDEAKASDQTSPQQKARQVAARQAQQYARTRRTLMTGKPRMEFENTSVRDAIKALAEAGQFSIVLDPALEEAGIDLSARTVSLRASGMTCEDALYLMLPRECGYRIGPGYVLITTLEKSYQPLKTGTYSIQLALAEVPDFKDAPRFQVGDVISRASSQGSGTGLFGSAQSAPSDDASRATPDRIIEMVKKFVRNQNDRRIAPWDDEGGPATIQYLGGRLVVTQTDHGHRAVAKLLAAIE